MTTPLTSSYKEGDPEKDILQLVQTINMSININLRHWMAQASRIFRNPFHWRRGTTFGTQHSGLRRWLFKENLQWALRQLQWKCEGKKETQGGQGGVLLSPSKLLRETYIPPSTSLSSPDSTGSGPGRPRRKPSVSS